jgi:hypothetical protein
MAYSSSSNPFFMLDKHKRSLGDSGESTRLTRLQLRSRASNLACFCFQLTNLLFSVYTKYDLPEKKPLTNSPSHGHH